MTEDEYHKIFLWDAYKKVETRSGLVVRSFDEKSLPKNFKIGGAKFELQFQRGFMPRYTAFGITLALEYPQYIGDRIGTSARWSASTMKSMFKTPHKSTPMKALAALQARLLEDVLKAQQSQESYNIVSAMLSEE